MEPILQRTRRGGGTLRLVPAPWVRAAAALVLGSWLCAPARGQVPPDKQAVILTRAISYDKNLRARAGNTLVIGVLYKPGVADSESTAAELLRAFKSIEGIKVQELPLSVVKLAYTGKEPLKSAIVAGGIDALYCCPSLDSDLAGIREVSHQQHVITLASRQAFIPAGLSIGVFSSDGKPTIMINLAASRDEGAELATELLRLATVVR